MGLNKNYFFFLLTETPRVLFTHDYSLHFQPLNTLEQDAFFAPNSTSSYQEEPEPQYSSPVYRNAQPVVQPVQPVQPVVPTTNFESFTNNRPFQFIQTSYVMPDPQGMARIKVSPNSILFP